MQILILRRKHETNAELTVCRCCVATEVSVSFELVKTSWLTAKVATAAQFCFTENTDYTHIDTKQTSLFTLVVLFSCSSTSWRLAWADFN